MAAPILPLDTAERHCVVSELLGVQQTVLDVGGRPGELARFLPGTRVVTANVDPPADVRYEGAELPFADGSFDAVTSIDVLEHLPADARRAHVEELVRVARSRVVLCCPLGTPAHVEAERELAARYPHPFLEQHLAYGLPAEDELRSLASGLELAFELWFHGDFRVANEQFALSREARRFRPWAVFDYAVQRSRWKPNLALSAESDPFTNRVFLVGSRTRRAR
jgi:SAM-dependent methyltransferase